MKKLIVLVLIPLLSTACSNMPGSGATDAEITEAMRLACPLLPDDSLQGFVTAVDALRAEGLEEPEALESWVQGCSNIPPDGNFQGDVDACADCLAAIVEGVYP